MLADLTYADEDVEHLGTAANLLLCNHDPVYLKKVPLCTVECTITQAGHCKAPIGVGAHLILHRRRHVLLTW